MIRYIRKKNSSGVEKRRERWHQHLVRLPGGYPHPRHRAGCRPLPCVWTSPDTATVSLNSFVTYNFAFQPMKPIGIGLAGGSGDPSCNFYRSPSSHFARLPQLRRATSLRVRAASSCQRAAATFQRPGRKMPAMTICEGNRQNRSTPCHSAFDAVPSSTEVLKC